MHKIKLVIMAITLLLLFSLTSAEEGEYDKVIRTANTDTVCNDGVCQLTIYSTNVNIFDDLSGQYIPFTEYVDIFVSNGNLVLSKGEDYSVSFMPIFEMQNGQRYYWSDIPIGIEKDLWKQEYEWGYKYGVDFNYVPDNIKENIQYVILHMTDSTGLTWDDVVLENNSIIVKNKVRFSHDDILQSYTIPIINKTDIVIGNLANNFNANGDGTWNISFDPSVELDSTDVIEDTDVRDSQADYAAYVQYNTTGAIPAGQKIDSAVLSMYRVQDTDDNDMELYLVPDQSCDLINDNAATIFGYSVQNLTASTCPNGNGKWCTWNITNIYQTHYDLGTNLFTVRVTDPDEVVNDGSTKSTINWQYLYIGANTNIYDSKEGTNKHYLTIVYSELPAGDEDTCTPTTGQNWAVTISDNCTISGQDYNVANLTITGSTGFFRVVNSNITTTRKILDCSDCKFILEPNSRFMEIT